MSTGHRWPWLPAKARQRRPPSPGSRWETAPPRPGPSGLPAVSSASLSRVVAREVLADEIKEAAGPLQFGVGVSVGAKRLHNILSARAEANADWTVWLQDRGLAYRSFDDADPELYGTWAAERYRDLLTLRATAFRHGSKYRYAVGAEGQGGGFQYERRLRHQAEAKPLCARVRAD